MMIQTDKTRLWRVKELDNILRMRACFKHFAFSNHYHDDFAIGLVEEGVQTFRLKGNGYRVPAGSLFTVNPGDVHDGQSGWDHGYRYTTLFVPAVLVAEILCQPAALPFFSEPVNSHPEPVRLMKELITSLDQDAHDPLDLHGCFDALICSLFPDQLERSPGSSLTHPGVQKACEFINDMAAEPISLEDMAEAAGLSRFHLLRLFKQHTSMAPGLFLQNRRLQLARQAIERGSSLGDAALQSGFYDQSHLNRRFKAAFGLTPRQYQQACLG